MLKCIIIPLVLLLFFFIWNIRKADFIMRSTGSYSHHSSHLYNRKWLHSNVRLISHNKDKVYGVVTLSSSTVVTPPSRRVHLERRKNFDLRMSLLFPPLIILSVFGPPRPVAMLLLMILLDAVIIFADASNAVINTDSVVFSPTVGDIVADNEAVIVGDVTYVPADVIAFILLFFCFICLALVVFGVVLC